MKSKITKIVSILLSLTIGLSICCLPKMTVLATGTNLLDYSFDEKQYLAAEMAEGDIIRTKEFIRGIGATFYFKNEDGNIVWDSSNAGDYLDELRINSVRMWGLPSNLASYKKGNRTVMSTTQAKGYDQSVGNKGTENIGIKFTQNTHDVFAAIKNSLSSFSTFDGMEGHLLGNEYRNYSSTVREYGGYDDYTQNQFKNVWLKNRFSTIDNLKQKLGYSGTVFNSWKDWSDVPSVLSWSGEVGSWQRKLWLEFYNYLQTNFEDLIRTAYNSEKSTYPELNIGYAKIIGTFEPFSVYADLSFLDFGGQNLYMDNSFDDFSYDINNQISLSGNKPFYATETGFRNSVENSAKKYKQSLALFYMHPQVAGTYAFTLADTKGEFGLVNHDREKLDNYYAVKKAYTDFQYLDKYFIGAFESPIVAFTNGKFDELSGSGMYANIINSVLSANGVSSKIIQSDKASDISSLDLNKMIIADSILYQNPDGTEDMASAINSFATNNKVISFNDKSIVTLYNDNAGLNALKNNNNYMACNSDLSDQTDIWSDLAEFLHGDFVDGNVIASKDKIDNTAIRVLDTVATDISNIEQTLLYNDGRLYLCVVNTSDNSQDVSITLGVNDGISINFHPTLLAADGNVSVDKPDNYISPSWTDSKAIRYGTLEISNLDTYAFIDLGMAVYDGKTTAVSEKEIKTQKIMYNFDDRTAEISDYTTLSYGATAVYDNFNFDGGSSLKIDGGNEEHPYVQFSGEFENDFAGTGIAFKSQGVVTDISLISKAGKNLLTINNPIKNGDTYYLDYNSLGLSDDDILTIDKVRIGFIDTIYVDTIVITNPTYSPIDTLPGVITETSAENVIYDKYLKRPVNMSATSSENGLLLNNPSIRYTSVILNFEVYCDNIVLSLKNTGTVANKIPSFKITYMDGTTLSLNGLTIAIDESKNITLTDLKSKGISTLDIIFDNGSDTEQLSSKEITIASITVNEIINEKVVSVAQRIENLNPFNYMRAIEAYNGLNESQLAALYNEEKLFVYAPSVEGTAICFNNGNTYGQMAFSVVNPDKFSSTMEIDGYVVSDMGIVVLPHQLLDGAELTAETPEIVECSKKITTENVSDYDAYKVILLNSTDYKFVNMSVRAYVTYTNGNNTVTIYSHTGKDNGEFTRSYNTTCRLVANEYLKNYKTAKFDENTDFTKAYSLETVWEYIQSAVRWSYND